MPWNRETEDSQEESMKEYTNSQIIELIDEHIHSDRDRQMLKSRLVDGLTFEQLAERYDLSVRQTKRIIYKEQEIIFKHLDC